MNAENMIDAFIRSYSGMFGTFVKDEGSDGVSASASSPDGDSTNIVRIEIPENITEEYENRKAFIMSKRKRLGPMGKLVEFSHGGSAEESYGGILNFKLLEKSGGFFFYTARKGNVLIFVQAYSTTGKGQIPDAERDRIIDMVLGAV